jgi:hypothetical protein
LHISQKNFFFNLKTKFQRNNMDKRNNISENRVSGSSHAHWCTECGAPLPAGAKFCGECGASVNMHSDNQPEEMTNRATLHKQQVMEEPDFLHTPQPGKKGKTFKKLVSGIVIVFAVAASAYYFAGDLKIASSTLISGISEKVKANSSHSVTGSADDEKVYPQKIDQATKTIEIAFLSGEKSQVKEVLTENALKQYDKELSAINKEGLVRFGDAFKSRELKAFSDLYAEYSILIDGKPFTVAVARQKDGSWKLMRF